MILAQYTITIQTSQASPPAEAIEAALELLETSGAEDTVDRAAMEMTDAVHEAGLPCIVEVH